MIGLGHCATHVFGLIFFISGVHSAVELCICLQGRTNFGSGSLLSLQVVCSKVTLVRCRGKSRGAQVNGHSVNMCFLHKHKSRGRHKGWLTEVLKRPVNHKSWLTGFRIFIRIPSTSQPAPPDWISGYLDIWIMVTNLLRLPPSGLLCGCRFFFPEKTSPSGVCNVKQCFLHAMQTIFSGTGLDKCRLKSQCERFQYGTKLMARKCRI